MTLQSKPFIAMILASIFIFFIVFTGNPVWQIKDDVYYAMLADGYGLVDKPVIEISYMHPLVGRAISGLRSLGFSFGYATYLYLCLWLGGIAIAYRFLKNRSRMAAVIAVAAGVGPVALLPQYTTLAGFLVASVALLWMTDKSTQLTRGEWIYGFTLLFLASLLRFEMAVLAAVCLSPVLIANAYTSGWLNRIIAIKFILCLLVVWAVYFLTSLAFGDPRMAEFYRYNSPIAVFLNYSYGAALTYTKMTLPQGISENDLSLLNNWFFAYTSIIEPDTLNKLIDQVSFRDVVRQRYWETVFYVKNLPTMVFFWLTISAFFLALLSRHRYSIFAGIFLFMVANITFALLQKPFPERVAMSISLGFFLLAFLTYRQDLFARKSAAWTTIIAFFLLIPIVWIIIADRIDLASQSRKFEKDFSLLRGNDVIYAWIGEIPLRADFRPFRVMDNVPPLVFLGTMYLLPQVAEDERTRGCGGFISCLVSGARLKLIASDENLKQLNLLLQEHYGKNLVTLNRNETPSFTLYVVTARNSQDETASSW